MIWKDFYPDKVYRFHRTTNNVHLVKKKTRFSKFLKNLLKALLTFYWKGKLVFL